jgi:glucose/arabinose dehydrogenase
MEPFMNPTQEHDSKSRPAGRLLGLVALFLLFVLAANAFAATTPENKESSPPNAPQANLDLSLVPFASGLDEPIGIVSNGDRRLFILERKGVIRIARTDGTIDPTAFLDIKGRVDSSKSETGLLGIAFHPQYHDNGYFYLNYTNLTDTVRRTRISRFKVTADPDVADASSEEILLTVVQPARNHNAGHILFGPDGYLYIPLGDGGSGGALAQDPTTVLGKVLRIDVDSVTSEPADCYGEGTGNYTVPDNPVVNGSGGTCDEIWASGLRNPWRSSFDSQSGDLFISDVGQNSWEEVNQQAAASTGGENYGWPCYEGNASYNPNGCGPSGDYTFPVFEYSQATGGCTVIGGYVYRGSRYPAMVGHYLLADFCSGHFWDLVPDVGGWTSMKHNNLGNPWSITAFGEACDGELYVTNKGNGQIYHLQENSPAPAVQIPNEVNADSWLYFPFLVQSAC